MNSPESRTASKRARSSSISGAYCALTSTSGVGTARKATGAATADHEIGHAGHHEHGDRVVDVVELLVERLPASACGVARPREGDAPERRADEREHDVAAERHPEDPGGNRDERPGDGSDPPDQDRPVTPAVEPALRALQALVREVEPPSAALEERSPAVDADRPAQDRADRVA